ncbi:MAG: nucleoside hydrolase [Lachnospiraceae bacterium]|nr:nucleoside hydrolase [Lachnospiraceae bacterium]
MRKRSSGWKIFALVELALIIMAAVICVMTAGQGGKNNKNAPADGYDDIYINGGQKRKLIIDTDTGADDASALILAAKNKNVEILGVVTLAGNVDLKQSVKNALMALEVAGCDAKVYRGSEQRFDGAQINAFSVFGSDGMGDAGLISPKGSAEQTDAVDFILETVSRYPGEVELVALGPATNIANAIKKDPETMKKVKMIWSMGTAGFGPGNASPVAEFNVYGDAKAYKYMLDSGLPVTVIGLDMCDGDAMWTGAQFAELEKAGATGSFVARSFAKIREFYASNGSADATMNCDSLAMTCVLYPGFIKDSVKTHGSCITDEGECYAQVLFYKEGFTYDLVKNDFDHNVTVVTDVDKANYFGIYLKAVSE